LHLLLELWAESALICWRCYQSESSVLRFLWRGVEKIYISFNFSPFYFEDTFANCNDIDLSLIFQSKHCFCVFYCDCSSHVSWYSLFVNSRFFYASCAVIAIYECELNLYCPFLVCFSLLWILMVLIFTLSAETKSKVCTQATCDTFILKYYF